MLGSDEYSDVEGVLSLSNAGDIVELIVLTSDDAFLLTLREAVGASRRLWHVPSADKVSDLLVAGQVGILVLDTQVIRESASIFVAQIKRQFPDLVVLVAGNRDAEAALAGLISSGLVYRFIHKPVSPARARLFADAAVKKYQEQRMHVAVSQRLRGAKRGKWPLAAGAACATLAVLVAVYAMRHRSNEEDGAPRRTVTTTSESPLLERAAAALADNRLVAPTGANALELYLQELARDPADTAARAGLADVRERLLARAENALLQERLDEAATAIEVAKNAGVEAGRIAFLSAQLAKSREQRTASQAAPRVKGESRDAEPQAGAVPNAGDGEDGLTQTLSLAAERTQEGRLIDPEDSARYYVEQALRIDANSSATQAAEQSLALALLSAAHVAIERRDFTQATQLLAAADGIASPANVSNLQRLLQSAREQADTDAKGQLSTSTSEPLHQDPARQDPVRQVSDAAPSHAAAPDIMAASDLTLLKSVPPSYPIRAAEAAAEGWVELDFTVLANGDVKNITVHAANPEGLFDGAAKSALSHWRYAPVLRDGKPTDQRARIRIRFTLKN